MEDSDWMYDSYQDHSDLSGILAEKRESSSEDEEFDADGKSTAGSGSTATLVDNKENRTPLVGSTPASRLSSTTQMNSRKDKTINVSALIERNKELEGTVYDLRLKISAINKDLPYIMIRGKDHLAEYIQFKNDNEALREKLAEYEKNIEQMKSEFAESMKQDRDRLDREHTDQLTHVQSKYAAACQELDDLREERPLVSPRDFDQSMASDTSMYSVRSQRYGMMELRIEGLEKDLKAEKIKVESEKRVTAAVQRECEELRRKLEEKETEWQRRESIASRHESFHIGIDRNSIKDMREQINTQSVRIDTLEEELKTKNENENRMAQLIKVLMKQKADLENELRMREASISVMENGEIDEIMRELLELSEMNSKLQEECRKRGAMKMRRNKGDEEVEAEDEVGVTIDIKKELETTVDLCEQYQKMGDRLAPLQQRVVAMNKSIMERRSFLEGQKAFEVSGLTPVRLCDGSNGRSGTPGTPIGKGQSRLLQSVLQRSVLNVSHAEILSCSINTSQGIKHAKDKLIAMRESCRRLFNNLKSSYTLFDEIRLALGGDENSELARQMKNLQMDLDMSRMESDEADKAIELVENSLFELQSILENSIAGGQGRESDFNLSAALEREERKNDENRKDMTYSIEVMATGERQDVTELREKLSTLVGDHEILNEQFEELKKTNEEMKADRGDKERKYREVEKEREDLYREMEDRRVKEKQLIEENKNLVIQLEDALNDVKRCKAEMEETGARMQDEIDRLDAQAVEANRLIEVEKRLKEKEDEMEIMKRSMNNKEAEVESINHRLEEISKELKETKDEERRNGVKMRNIEREAESSRENFERTSREYAKINEELEDRKKREEDLEMRLQKYKYKAIEEEHNIRKANVRDHSSTQTSLTMDKLARMEWSKNEMSGELSRLGRTIENCFLSKGEYDINPQRCFDENDVTRLVDIVEKVKEIRDEDNVLLKKNNEELRRYMENAKRNESPLSSDEKGDGGQDGSTITVARVNVKYSDPLRQLFFALTFVSNEVIQRYKKAQTKMCEGRLSLAEYNHILDMMRDVRTKMNERLAQTDNKSSSADSWDAMTNLRMTALKESNEKLNSRINNLVSALRSNWTEEEKAKLLKKVIAEMSDISDTLKTVGVRQDRIPSSSSAATTSTRKI